MKPGPKATPREQALNQAFEGHEKSLLLSIRKRVRDQVEAQDIAQDVFAEFLENYDLGNAIESAGAWLFRVAQNKIIDRFRKKKYENDYREAMLEQGSVSPSNPPDEELFRTWLQEELLDALEMLPEEQREVFILHELEGQSFQDISKNTGISVNTLLSRKRYAVLFLRELLKEVYDELE